MIESILPHLRCPLCGGGLLKSGGSLMCDAGHCYDVARQGYVNFAPHHRDALYTRSLFESRTRVFLGGLFAPVVRALSQALDAYMPQAHPLVLDAGCGEGYYLRALKASRPMTRAGFDLSKDAVRMAAAQDKDGAYFVCDLSHIPLADGCADALLDVFTPANYAEFGRVLKPDGIVLKLAPREGYLCELRRAAGAQLRTQRYDGGDVQRHAARHMKLLCTRVISYRVGVTSQMLSDIACMTPMLAEIPIASLDLSGIDAVTVDETLYVGTISH